MAWFTRSRDDTAEQHARGPGPRSARQRLDRGVPAEEPVASRRLAVPSEGALRHASGGFTVTVLLDHPVRRLRFLGELDLASSDNVADLLTTVIDRHACYVELDLAGLDFIDCRGLGALLRLRAMMVDPGAIALRNVPEQAALLLRTSGVDALFSIY